MTPKAFFDGFTKATEVAHKWPKAAITVIVAIAVFGLATTAPILAAVLSK